LGGGGGGGFKKKKKFFKWNNLRIGGKVVGPCFEAHGVGELITVKAHKEKKETSQYWVLRGGDREWWGGFGGPFFKSLSKRK